MTLQCVVIGMDFSEPSVRAAQWATEYIAPDDAEIVFVNAISLPEAPTFLRDLYPPNDASVDAARARAESRLTKLAESMAPRRCRTEVRIGRPESVLSGVARDAGASLIVAAAHGQGGELWKVLGSTGERLLRRAQTSVLLARGLKDTPPRTVLLTLDESELRGALIEWAAHLVASFGARIIVLHVGPPSVYDPGDGGPAERLAGPDEDELRRRTQDWISAQVAGTPLAGARTEIAFGDPGFEISATADRLHADLLIIGRHSRANADGAFMGGITEFIIRNDTRPVLVVAGGPYPVVNRAGSASTA